MLLDLEKLFVKWEDLRRPPCFSGGKAAFGMRQNLLKMPGRSHPNLP
jgi:hypothetical protein